MQYEPESCVLCQKSSMHELNPPWLNKEMLDRITGESIPRSVTYSLQPFANEENEIQHITFADTHLEDKQMYSAIVTNPNREQVPACLTIPSCALDWLRSQSITRLRVSSSASRGMHRPACTIARPILKAAQRWSCSSPARL